MLRSDADYFRQRAAAEREMARNAASPDIAAIHEELAREYDSLAASGRAPGMLLRAAHLDLAAAEPNR